MHTSVYDVLRPACFLSKLLRLAASAAFAVAVGDGLRGVGDLLRKAESGSEEVAKSTTGLQLLVTGSQMSSSASSGRLRERTGGFVVTSRHTS